MYFKKKKGEVGKNVYYIGNKSQKVQHIMCWRHQMWLEISKTFSLPLFFTSESIKRLSPPFRDIFEYARDETLDSPISVEKNTRKIVGKTKEKAVYAAFIVACIFLEMIICESYLRHAYFLICFSNFNLMSINLPEYQDNNTRIFHVLTSGQVHRMDKCKAQCISGLSWSFIC